MVEGDTDTPRDSIIETLRLPVFYQQRQAEKECRKDQNASRDESHV